MKRIMKLVCIVLCMMLFSVSAFAQVDLTNMTTDELKALQREIALKLCPAAQEKIVIWDDEYVKVSFVALKEQEWGDGVDIKLIAENKTDKKIGVMCDTVTVNKWTVMTMGLGEIGANANLMGNVDVFESLAEYGINSISDIHEVTMILYVYDCESYDTLKTSETITLTF